jgi:hypothetical protein
MNLTERSSVEGRPASPAAARAFIIDSRSAGCCQREVLKKIEYGLRMALPEIKRAAAERDLKKSCAEFVPPEYRIKSATRTRSVATTSRSSRNARRGTVRETNGQNSQSSAFAMNPTAMVGLSRGNVPMGAGSTATGSANMPAFSKYSLQSSATIVWCSLDNQPNTSFQWTVRCLPAFPLGLSRHAGSID